VLSPSARFWTGVLLIGGWPISLAVYLVRATSASFAEARREIAARPQRIKALERELGL
jgi:hypothetical protein